MKKAIFAAILFIAVGLFPASVSEAHPGRTSSDGCHYCRTNCDYWGVPWNERHCHNGYSTPSYESSPAPTSGGYVPVAERSNLILREVVVKVYDVVDGDTIKVSFLSGSPSTATIRLLGIDTPESKDPRKPVECFSMEATEYLKSLVDGKTVTLLTDDAADNKDKYGRLLRYLVLDEGGRINRDVNGRMVSDGYAYALLKYPMSQEKKDVYKLYENTAREEKKGLWAEDTCNGGREFLVKNNGEKKEDVKVAKKDNSQVDLERRNTLDDKSYIIATEQSGVLEKIINFFRKLFGL